MRKYIDDNWQFTTEYTDALFDGTFAGQCETVRIPHSVAVTPFNYFSEDIYQMVSGYRRVLRAEEEWKGKVVLLTFDAVAHAATVYLNGKQIGEHYSGYTAFTIDITDELKYGEDNILVVKVDSNESLNVPPFGFVIDYMTYGGIYRDVYLDIKNPLYISDVYVHPAISIENGKIDARVVSDISVFGMDTISGEVGIRQKLMTLDGEGVHTYDVMISSEVALGTDFPVHEVELWSPENPRLYKLETELIMDGRVVDSFEVRTAFRTSEFRTDGYYLNGKKYRIRGLNRHQSYSYVGYAMPKSMQVMDVNVLKHELSVNAVRTSHYPQSHYFLDACDEQGLLVFTEFPGWQHIGDEEWKNQACKNLGEMILQYRNHPSIMLWGVRINESKDDDEFYTRTNEIAHRLDPYRQTGGVKAAGKMSFLEDVYTYNDFSHMGANRGCSKKKDVTTDVKRPYMVTEYNGHMYPTKSFDWEEHRLEHAMRHANVLDAIAGEEDIAGSFGWCMADYNTHKDFGSGDRICYHGVLDMFRNPKLAASVYAAQGDEDVVLDISSSMDIGEHPASNRGKIYIFTNADSVKMYKNGRFIKEYRPEESSHKNMNAGPILVDDLLGDLVHTCGDYKKKQADAIKTAINGYTVYGIKEMPLKAKLAIVKGVLVYHMSYKKMTEIFIRFINDWGGESTSFKFEAIKDGKVVKTVVKEPMETTHLDVTLDHSDLTEDQTYDVAALRIKALDQNGNILNYYQEPVKVTTEGPIELIGPDIVGLKGGMAATYIKSCGENSKLTVTVKDMNNIVVTAK